MILLQLFKRQADETTKAKEKQEKRQSHFKVVAKRVCVRCNVVCERTLKADGNRHFSIVGLFTPP